MNVAYNVDCMEYMKSLPDKAFDLAVCDPPYRDQSENRPTKDMRKNGTMKNMARAIDGNELLKKFAYSPADTEDEQVFNAAARKIIQEAPTLTQPNEWVSVEKRNPNPHRVGTCEGCTWQHLDGDDYPCTLCNRNPHLTDRYQKEAK